MSVPLLTFSPKHTPQLLRLLDEYSRRLQSLLDEFERLRDEKVTLAIQGAVIFFTIFIAATAPRFLSQAVLFPTVVAIASLWFHTTIVSLRFLVLGRFKLKRTGAELNLLIPKVERLLRAASQLEQHTRQDSGSKFEFDLQLSYTEEVLRRARTLIPERETSHAD